MQIILFNIILLYIHIVAFETIARYSPSPRVVRDASKSSKLCALDLSHNGLRYLCNRTFLELKAVEIVNLSLASNTIRCIAQHAFLGLAELERLDLSRNNLTYIHHDTFNHNRKLYWLSLADNKLFTLPSHDEVFIYVHSLRFLCLSGCSVTDISHHIFKDINNIKYLNISHNQIRNIQKGTFDLLKELRCLDISFNNLTALHNDTCFSSRNLSEYLASDSPESCLATEVSSSLLKVKVNNNPWDCDCPLALRNLICKKPSRDEKLRVGFLKPVDCKTTTTASVARVTEEPPPAIPRSSHNAESIISNATDIPTTVNNTAPLSATFSELLMIVIIILLSIVIVLLCAILILRYYKHKRRRPQTDDNAITSLVGAETQETGL